MCFTPRHGCQYICCWTHGYLQSPPQHSPATVRISLASLAPNERQHRPSGILLQFLLSSPASSPSFPPSSTSFRPPSVLTNFRPTPRSYSAELPPLLSPPCSLARSLSPSRSRLALRPSVKIAAHQSVVARVTTRPVSACRLP